MQNEEVNIYGLIVVGIAAFVSGCRSNPDGLKSETYTKTTTKTRQLIVE